jgi:hypothetical protein
VDEAAALLTTVQYTLTIAERRWITPVRPRGFAQDDTLAWELLGLWHTDPWSDPMIWYASRSTSPLSELFALVDDRWQDEVGEQFLRSAVHYYREASHGLVNKQLIIGGALLELAGWQMVVEERSLMSGAGFDRLETADRMRLLLGLLSARVGIPTDLKSLTKHASRRNNLDGPGAIAELRHSSVHAKRHAESWKWDPDVWTDAAQLNQHYCDLALLGALGYRGYYVNCTTARYAEDHEPVPWSS